ncbi:MAG: hypothetical protein LBQ28_01490, partial [Prevotellaceae bacterium]|nr:hypothetical protein [Prevotellaceae bacterium]
MQVKIVTTKQTKVTFTLKNVNYIYSVDIAAGSIYVKDFNVNERAALYSNATGVSDKSLRIQSTEPISVYALTQTKGTADATNVFPVKDLGTEYYHISYKAITDFPVYYDGYTIVAVEDNTKIYEGNTLKATLDAGYVYSNYDYLDASGIKITSDKPVAYFVTNSCAYVPIGIASCDCFYQQLAPVNMWGNNFLIPVTKRTLERVRIVASQSGTVITQTGGTIKTEDVNADNPSDASTFTLNEGHYVDMEIGLATGGCYISASKPIAVASYLPGYSYTPIPASFRTGDPSMAWVPPVEQLINNVVVAPFIPQGSTNLTEHFVLIVTPTATRDQTMVAEGNNPPTSLTGGAWTTGNGTAGSAYSFYSVQLTSKTASYYFTNPKGLFVMGYGLGGAESYYYLAGSAARDLDAAFYIDDMHYQDINGGYFCNKSSFNFKAVIQYAMSTTPGYLKWYIDGTEEVAARDKLTWSKTLTPGVHTVKIEVLDLYGEIKTLTTTFTIDLTTVSITGPTKIGVGQTTTLSPTTGGTWVSRNTAVATVDNKGIVTGVSEGETDFVFITTDGCVYTTGVVTVSSLCKTTNDTVFVMHNDTIRFDALANDEFACNKNQITVGIVANSGLHYGNLTINSDKTFTYKADKGGYGIDSVEYTITCQGSICKSKVYFIVSKPLSAGYVACENVELTIGMYPISGVEYYWYDAPTGGNLTQSNKNELTFTKNASDVQSWHIEPRYKGKKMPARYKISVLKSNNCGTTNPTGCAVNGQLLFREDFGGNNVSDVRISKIPLPSEVTDYNFREADVLNPNDYAILKYNSQAFSGSWQANFSDHTHPNDMTRGYMFMVDASTNPGKFYEHKITGLCDNTSKMYFSAWATNLIPKEQDKTKIPHDPMLKFELSDNNGNILATYITSAVPRDERGKTKWWNYGFEFDPKGNGSLTLKIYNNMLGSKGNDFILDDIEIRLCTPLVILNTAPDTVTLCQKEKFSIDASFTDGGEFGNNLVGRWQYSTVNDAQAVWTTLKEITTVNSPTLNSTFIIDNVTLSNKGYYRFIIGNSSTIDYRNCRASSKAIYLNVLDKLPQTPKISSLYGNYKLCGNTNTLTLMVTNPENGMSYQWYKDGSILTSETGLKLLVNSPGLYKVSVTDAGTNCSIYADTTITQDLSINFPDPVISSVSGGTTICGTGGSVFLKLNNQNAYSTNATYQWYKDGQIINNATNFNYSVTTQGDYYVVVTDATCAAASASIKIISSGSGTTTVPVLKSQGDVKELCSTGSSIRLYVDNSTSFGATATYVWYRNEIEVLRGAGLDNYVANSAGKYKVVIYETTGCSSLSNEIELTQGNGAGITKPVIVSESGTTVICGSNGGIMLKLTTTYTGGSISYQWFKGDTLIIGATGIQYFATESGNYSLVVTVDNCSSQSDKVSIAKDSQSTTTVPVLKSQGDVKEL